MPAGFDHSSRGSQGVAPPHPSTIAQTSLSHAPPADYQPQGPARPASAVHHETGQVPRHPQASGPPQQHDNVAAGPSLLPDHALGATASDAACPQVQFGVFTNLASGGMFMGPSKMSAAARKAMSSFASVDPAAAPATQKTAGNSNGSWQQATCFAHPGARAVTATRGMQGTGNKQALKNSCLAHQQPLSGRQHQSAAQPASCMSLAEPAEVMKLTATKKAAAADSAGPTATDTAGLIVTDTASPTVVHAATVPAAALAAAKACGNSDAAGSCPPVQFGVFTNLKSGGMWAPPGKLSEKAKQRANEMFPDGALQVPAAAAAAAAPAFADQAKPAQQQLAGSQPAKTASGVGHTTGQLFPGMLCPSSYHEQN